MFGEIRNLPIRFRISPCVPGQRNAMNQHKRKGEDMEHETEPAPLCPLCKINPREFDYEPPGPGSYYSYCGRCSGLVGTREHTHTYYGSPAQVAAGTVRAGHSWRTTVLLHPIIEGDRHVGYRCTKFEQCGWEQRFTAKDMDPCSTHSTHPKYHQVPKGVCVNHQEHRQARGECDERGYITDYGREQERVRSDAANWDPGRYIDRTPVD